ncbi:MAG: hypothetical protein ACUVUF_07815 [Candidatus Bathycorpusculaceae bacterium]
MEVKITYNGQQVGVKLKKMTWGDQKKLIRDVVGKLKLLGREIPQVEVDIAKLKEAVVMYSIAEAPFEVTVENLEKLSGEDLNKLFDAAIELNPFRDIIGFGRAEVEETTEIR